MCMVFDYKNELMAIKIIVFMIMMEQRFYVHFVVGRKMGVRTILIFRRLHERNEREQLSNHITSTTGLLCTTKYVLISIIQITKSPVNYLSIQYSTF